MKLISGMRRSFTSASPMGLLGGNQSEDPLWRCAAPSRKFSFIILDSDGGEPAFPRTAAANTQSPHTAAIVRLHPTRHWKIESSWSRPRFPTVRLVHGIDRALAVHRKP